MIDFLKEPSLLNHIVSSLHRNAFGLVDILEGEDLFCPLMLNDADLYTVKISCIYAKDEPIELKIPFQRLLSRQTSEEKSV